MVRSFDETIAANLRVSIAVLVAFAAVIAFGVVYNAARIALSEPFRKMLPKVESPYGVGNASPQIKKHLAA